MADPSRDLGALILDWPMIGVRGANRFLIPKCKFESRPPIAEELKPYLRSE